MLKSLLLGSAAVAVSVGAGVAADIPTAEPASQYMRICDAFGAGFWYIPAGDTCLSIGGYVRAEMHFVAGDVGLLLGGPSSDFNNWTSRARGNVQFDARTQTDFGLIKTYIEFQMSVGPDDFTDDYSGTETELSAAFVEISNDRGVFTAGHTGSFFDFYGSDDYGTRIDIDDNTTEQNLFAYTLNVTSSLRGTLSVEDPNSSGRRLDGADPHAGQEVPDLVGNLRLDQEWGSAQVMGAVRDDHDSNGSALGFAVGAGFTVTLPIKKVGFSMQVGYADGALGYITTDPGGLGDMGGPNADDTNTAWNVRAGLTAPVTDQLSAWLDGSFTHVEDNSNDDDYDYWALVAGAEFAPNDAIAMGPEFAYNNIKGDDPGEDGSIWGLMWRIQSNF